MAEIDVVVGTLGRAHGLLGEIFVNLTTDSPQERFYPGAHMRAGAQGLTVNSFRIQGGRGLARFDEVTDRTRAEELTGARLVADVDADESTDEDGVYFDHQLVGMSVVAISPDTGANDAPATAEPAGDDAPATSAAGAQAQDRAEEDVLPDNSAIVGEVVRVEHMGFQDMLVVSVSVSGEERLVPFVDDLVPVVDLEARRVVVRAIPGLLEDEA